MERLLCIQHNLDWTNFLTPTIALIAAFIAFNQLKKNNRSRKADFTHRLDSDFFSSRTRNLIILLEFKAIKFCISSSKGDQDDPFFEVNKELISRLPSRYDEVKKYCETTDYEISTFEMDDYLLGQFEKIGLYLKKKIIDLECVYEIFDYYLQLTNGNNEIQDILIGTIKMNKEKIFMIFLRKLLRNVNNTERIKIGNFLILLTCPQSAMRG